jgi:pinin
VKSRVVSKETGLQRREVIAMQSRQHDLERNKRMFGSLLGTLQKFKKEENFLKSKEEKKAQIEKKVEQQEMEEKIKLKQERDALIESRKRKQFEVKALETKMEKWKDLEIWEESQRHLVHFIRTSSKPEVFWQPKTFDEKTTELKNKTEQEVNEKILERRQQVEDEIKAIEEHNADLENSFGSVDVKVERTSDSQNGKSHGGSVKSENHERGRNIGFSSSWCLFSNTFFTPISSQTTSEFITRSQCKENAFPSSD